MRLRRHSLSICKKYNSFYKHSCPLLREPCDNTSRIHLNVHNYSYFRTQRIAIVVLTSSSVAVLARTMNHGPLLHIPDKFSRSTLHPCSWYAVQAQMLVDGAPTHGHLFQEPNPGPITSSYTFELTSSHRQFQWLISHPLLCLSNLRAKTNLCVCVLCCQTCAF